MDGQIRLGYQVATVCLQTTRFGRQWLAGQQHPGDTVSSACLAALLQAAEARLGCHPRRRTELLSARIAAQQALVTAMTQRLTALAEHAQELSQTREQTRRERQASQRRVTILQDAPAGGVHTGPFGALTQQLRRVQHLERREARLRAQQEKVLRQRWQTQAEWDAAQAALARLTARQVQLASENAHQWDAPRCRLRMDAGFCSGEIWPWRWRGATSWRPKRPTPPWCAPCSSRSAPEQPGRGSGRTPRWWAGPTIISGRVPTPDGRAGTVSHAAGGEVQCPAT